MVLKWDGPERSYWCTLFAITSLIMGVQGWNFDTMWVPIRVTSGMSFSGLLPLLWKLPCSLCVFDTWPNLLICWSQWTCRVTIGWEIWNLTVDTCFGQEMHQIESKMLNLWWFRQGSWKESKMVLKEPICPFINCVACILNLFGVMVLKWIKISSNFTMYVLYLSKYGCFAQGDGLTDCLWLDINWVMTHV